MFDTINTTVYSVSPQISGGIIWSIALEPLPTVFTQYGPLKAGNSMGTTPEDGNSIGKLMSTPHQIILRVRQERCASAKADSHLLTVVLYSALWANSSANVLVEEAVKEIEDNMEKLAQNAGLSKKFLYMAYANKGQGVIQSYGQTNVQTLREVSAKFDPRGVFQKKVPGGFKIPF